MVMHVGIISAVDQYLFTYSIFSFGSTVFILSTRISPSWTGLTVWSCLRSWNALWWRSGNAQQQIYKKKSTRVDTKNQVESFLVILDSG
jgi:hypothetical protein